MHRNKQNLKEKVLKGPSVVIFQWISFLKSSSNVDIREIKVRSLVFAHKVRTILTLNGSEAVSGQVTFCPNQRTAESRFRLKSI